MMRPGMSSDVNITDDIHELELELQLLKKKRIMVQQQQQMLARQRQHGYERPQMFVQSYGSHKEHDFSTLYDNSQPSVSKNNKSKKFGQKRQASDEPWKNPPKRFNASHNNQPKKGFQSNTNQPQVWASNQQPLMSLNFGAQPLTLSQPKPGISGNSSGSQFPVKPSKYVPPAKRNESSKANMILRSGCPVNNQMTGRLELALGFVLKEIKAKYMNVESYKDIFKGEKLLRVLKQNIRERIRQALVDKHVGDFDLNYKHFRNMYPIDTDKEMLDIVLTSSRVQEKQPCVAIQISHEVPPAIYIKHNMNRLLSVKLDEMFQKLQKLYSKNTDTERLDKIIEENLEFTQCSTPIDKNVVDVTDSTSHGKTDQGPDEIKETNCQAEETVIKNTDNKNSVDFAAWKKYNNKFFLPMFYEKLMNIHIANNLPYLLSSYKNKIMDILQTDKMYQITKDEIYRQGNAVNKGITNKSITNATTNKPSYVDNEKPKEYVVKILGKPHLPNREEMKSFLDNFEPSSTKKHKKQNNLLFVKLQDKCNYDSLLTADGMMFGDGITLKITSTEKIPASKVQTLKVIEDRVGDRLNNSNEIIPLNSELDEQITDLLSSIRKAEEADLVTKTGGELNNDDSVIECVVHHEIIDLVDDDKDTLTDENTTLVNNENPLQDNVTKDNEVNTQEHENVAVGNNEDNKDDAGSGDNNKENDEQGDLVIIEEDTYNENINDAEKAMPEISGSGENVDLK